MYSDFGPNRYDVLKLVVLLYLRLIGGSETAYRLAIRPFMEQNKTAIDLLMADIQPNEKPPQLWQLREIVDGDDDDNDGDGGSGATTTHRHRPAKRP